MSTNCIIAYEKEDKSIEGIRCHWDGYPERVGKILLNHYGNEKTKRLIELGAISVLGEEVDAPKDAKHSFDNPFPGVTVAYHRDRGEQRAPNFTAENIAAFLHKVPCVEYVYLLKNGVWNVYLNNKNLAYRLEELLK